MKRNPRTPCACRRSSSASLASGDTMAMPRAASPSAATRVEHAAVVEAVAGGLDQHDPLQAECGLHLPVSRQRPERRLEGRAGRERIAVFVDVHVAVARAAGKGVRGHGVHRVLPVASGKRACSRRACAAFTAPWGMRPCDDGGHLGRSFQRLVFDGRRRQAADVRRGDARAGGRASARLGIWSGARPTSSAQPAIRPASSARSRAASSTRLPREALMK